MADFLLNNLFYKQARTILCHYKVNFLGVNTDLLNNLSTFTLATVTKNDFYAYFL